MELPTVSNWFNVLSTPPCTDGQSTEPTEPSAHQRLVAICSLDNTHPRARLGADLLQSLVSKSMVISNEMTLDVINETLDIHLFVSPQESFSPRGQSLVLILVPSKTGTTISQYLPASNPRQNHPFISGFLQCTPLQGEFQV